MTETMARYLKILLLFIFVTAPALDIAFLDNQESTDHFSEVYHDSKGHDEEAAADLHCICHVFHNGFAIDKIAALAISDLHFKKHQTTNLAVNGLNPKPGLHPPSTTLS